MLEAANATTDVARSMLTTKIVAIMLLNNFFIIISIPSLNYLIIVLLIGVFHVVRRMRLLFIQEAIGEHRTANADNDA